MNERIKQLAEQAGFLNKDEESIGYFAELIVRECVDVCRKENWKILSEDTKGLKQFDRGMIYGRRIMAKELCDKIEERFGL